MAYVSKIVLVDAAKLAAGPGICRKVAAIDRPEQPPAPAALASDISLHQFKNQSADKPGVRLAAVCLTTGAMIETPLGPKLIETLEVGDLVSTRGSGPQPLRHVLHRRLAPLTLKDRPHLAPITIRAGSIGVGLPRRNLSVSPQHSVLISDPRLETMLGSMPCRKVAAQLVDVVPGIVAARVMRTVTYVHLAFDKDEVIFAEGVPTECSDLAGRGCPAMPDASAAEVQEVFGGLLGENGSVILPAQGGVSHEKGTRSSRPSSVWHATASFGPKPIRVAERRAGWRSTIFA